MEALVDTLCLLAQPKEGQQQIEKQRKQPEVAENQTVWKSDNQGVKDETFIQMGRKGGNRQPGWRGPLANQQLEEWAGEAEAGSPTFVCR